MTDEAAAAGLAALTICEALILSLLDRGLLDETEANGLLEDVIAVHRSAAAVSDAPDLHEKVVRIVDRILQDGNGTRALSATRVLRKS